MPPAPNETSPAQPDNQDIVYDLDADNGKIPWNQDGAYPYQKKMRPRAYARHLYQLQIELLKVQRWAKETDQRIAIIFEGRDAAGKGGTIKRYMEHLNPRGAHVVALNKPTDEEQSQWYFQRYVQHLPSKGEFIFFDRSWYNRAGVEKVMGFCTDDQYQQFLEQVPDFERMLVDSGINLTKFWFSISRTEQLRRFKARQTDPLKSWKLSPIDLASLDKWHDYTAAKDALICQTDTTHAPWTIIRNDDKKRGRINCMRYFLHNLDYPGKDPKVACAPNPEIVGAANALCEEDEQTF